MPKRGAGEGTATRAANGRCYARRSIGSRGATKVLSAAGATRKEALSHLAEKIRAHERDTDRVVDRRATLAEFLDWWLEVELAERVADGTLTVTTVAQYRNKVRYHISPTLGPVRLADLSPVHIRQWLTTLRRSEASDKTRKDAHAVLRNALGCAIRYELMDNNPAKLVEGPSYARPRRIRSPRTMRAGSWKLRPATHWRVSTS